MAVKILQLQFTLSFLILAFLYSSCVNTKTGNIGSADAKLSTENINSDEALVKSDPNVSQVLFFPDEIFLAIKASSDLKIDLERDALEQHENLQLNNFFKAYEIVEITNPTMALNPNLYRVKFKEGTELKTAINDLEEFPFVQYVEMIPINK